MIHLQEVSRGFEFCKELIKRKFKVKWYCNVRVDLKFETMQWMKRLAGTCHSRI